MKRQFTSLMLLLVGLVGFSALAETPGTKCGKYLRASQFGGWNNGNTEKPLKWGDEAGTWIYITFPDGLVINPEFAIGAQGNWDLDKTIIAGSGDRSFTNNNNGSWSQPCYYGGGRNMLWPGNQNIKAIRVNLPNSGKTFDYNDNKNPGFDTSYAGTITLYTEIPADIAEIEKGIPEDWNNRFVLQLWKIGANPDEPWDNSGGLFQAIKKGSHPIADEYQYNRDDKELGLKFIEVTDEKEKEAHQWATKENDYYTPEKSTRVFKIDFTSGADKDGIYVTVPTIADKNIGGYQDPGNDEDRKTEKNVQPFYRSGVRFGFLDTHFKEEGDGFNDHLRFVKWGHAFRLNEKSRPLNAFVSYDANNNANGFTDDFGTTSWNGVPCKPTDGNNWKNDKVDTDAFRNRAGWRNKRGDSRLLAEYNLWLKAIYLEVADDEKNSEYKHLYLSFVGEYDLQSGVVTSQDYVFIPSEGGSNVTETPNIFTQYNVMLGEPAFQRFYNLDATNDERVNYLLGFPYESSEGTPSQQYQKHTGKGQILYGLDYTDSYTSHSVRTVLTAAGEPCHFHSDKEEIDPIARTISIKAEGGKYYDLNDNNKPFSPETDDASRRGTLLPTTFGMLYDPEDEEHAPVTVKAVSTYTFPNSIHEEETFEHYYPIVINEDQKDDSELTVTADGLEHSGQRDFFADIHWSALSKQIDGKTLPVADYVLEAKGENNDQWETLNRDWSVWTNAGANITHRFDRYHSGAVQNFDYKVDYKVTGIHNWAYATGAVYKKERLIEGEKLYTPEAFRRDNPTISRAAEGVYSAGDKGFRYRLAPDAHVGQTTVTYDEKVTAIETIGADDNTAVRYYNLQGIETARPVSGQVYLMRRGNTVTKVVIP